MTKVTFTNHNSAFYTALKNDVNAYFQTKNLKKTGNWRLYLKSALFCGSAVVLYIVLLWGHLPTLPALALSALMGIVMAGIGFNIMHDACHGSYSSKRWVNNLMGLSMNAIGSNAFIWKQKHNVIHHTYPNIDGVDDDIAKSPALRHCPSQPYKPAHRFQHLYMFLLYGLSSILWAFFTDFQKYFSRKIYTTPLQKMSLQEHLIFWLSKVYYVVVFMIIPARIVGVEAWWWGFFTMHLAFGFALSIVFQLAHVVESTAFEVVTPDETHHQFNDWAEHQVRTTSDFATDNKLVSWYVGGLNFQVVHHLFPRVSHIHYPAIQPIIARNCERFGIRYNHDPSMVAAIGSHYRTMRTLGRSA